MKPEASNINVLVESKIADELISKSFWKKNNKLLQFLFELKKHTRKMIVLLFAIYRAIDSDESSQSKLI